VHQEGKINYWFLWLIILMGILSPLIYSAGTIRKLFLGWRTPTTWISALPSQGWVEVIGKVKGNPIQSLFTKTECAYWQLEVKEYHSSGRGGGRWRTVHKETSGPFEVDDLTGRIKILEGNTDLVLDRESVVENLSEQDKTLVEGLGIKTKGLLGFNKKMRVVERLVDPEAEILVLGRIQKSEGLISISGSSIIPQIISNLSKSEMLKTYFWRSIRTMILPYLIGVVFLVFYIYMIMR
jgi:hypothetical protein